MVLCAACARSDWIDWRFSRQPSGSVRASAAGAKVTGEMKVPHPGTYSLGSGIPIEGNVAGDVFTFQDLRGVLSGDVAVGGDDMVGRILSQWGVQRASLHRGSAVPNRAQRRADRMRRMARVLLGISV